MITIPYTFVTTPPCTNPHPITGECFSCGEVEQEACPSSKRDCRHHCNHSWSHDACCWCGMEWGEDGEEIPPSSKGKQPS